MIRLNEYYSAPQGEGPTTGTPSIFLRLSGCNLHCGFCDSWFTWNFKGTKFSNDDKIKNPKVDIKEEMKLISLSDLASKINELAFQNNISNIVITGGEPLIQQKELELFISEHLDRRRYKFEIETNGTILMSNKMMELIDQINCSPKLESSGNEKILRFKFDALKRINNHKNSIFKFVITCDNDLNEVNEIINQVGIDKRDVYLMPEGNTRQSQIEKFELTTNLAQKYGFKICPRLHILLHDSKRAV